MTFDSYYGVFLLMKVQAQKKVASSTKEFGNTEITVQYVSNDNTLKTASVISIQGSSITCIHNDNTFCIDLEKLLPESLFKIADLL